MRALVLALALFPLPVLAEPPASPPAPPAALGPPLSAAEFDAYATGKTLTYSDGGSVWGQEQYLPNRKVIWAFRDSGCEYGSWVEEAAPSGGPMLCFTYDNQPQDVNCWQFFHGPGGLVAQFMEGGAPLSEVTQTVQPMSCPGPEVGT